ncbi:galactoside 2-alpha-L-fucosyltransferase-like [Salvia splendens]|uniref:galactoside 2-alpha-L-fucosyltransferase-like n=1 Tax=Salvia splendens TaxID=180675 RepID=UPI001C275F2D|nr:galactoside 2-alpha-L-fucosyltransferase-like [Salvia splendens]
MPSFRQELHSLFPEKETVFHFLGRYLFHPTNAVWGLISRYYEAYLSKADVTVGIQIRSFDATPDPVIVDQILSCTTRENVLLEMSQQEGGANSSIKQKKKVSVLITSLSSGYFEQIRDLYWENPTTTGEVVAVFQPSNERYQQSEKQNHNRKAWTEIYLLSLTDKLVTSSSSTFGYVAQGLRGVRPWILSETENQTAPDPPCRRVMSMEPCFHSPAFFNCKTKRGIDPGAVVPHVRHCEDRSWGLKLFQNHSK